MKALYKVYVKNEIFLLPIQIEKIMSAVQESFTVNDLNNFQKMYSIKKITDTEDNEVDTFAIEKKCDLNLFLINDLLLVLDNKNEDLKPVISDNETLIALLEKMLEKNLEGLSHKEVHKEVELFLQGQDSTTLKNDSEEETTSIVQEKEIDLLSNVEFNLDWLKNAQKQLRKKEK